MRKDRTQFVSIESVGAIFSQDVRSHVDRFYHVLWKPKLNHQNKATKTNSKQIDRNHVCSNKVQVPCKKIKASRKQTLVKLTLSKPSAV